MTYKMAALHNLQEHIALACLLWMLFSFNPSTPELNLSAQRCMPRFFTGDFNF
jgi:hypothetical protein